MSLHIEAWSTTGVQMHLSMRPQYQEHSLDLQIEHNSELSQPFPPHPNNSLKLFKSLSFFRHLLAVLSSLCDDDPENDQTDPTIIPVVISSPKRIALKINPKIGTSIVAIVAVAISINSKR